MEEEKLMEDEAKKQKERNNEEGAKISLAQQKLSQLSQTELTQSTQKKKKIQTSNFMIKIPSLNFQNSKAQNFKFQIKNFLSSKVLEFEIRI